VAEALASEAAASSMAAAISATRIGWTLGDIVVCHTQVRTRTLGISCLEIGLELWVAEPAEALDDAGFCCRGFYFGGLILRLILRLHFAAPWWDFLWPSIAIAGCEARFIARLYCGALATSRAGSKWRMRIAGRACGSRVDRWCRDNRIRLCCP